MADGQVVFEISGDNKPLKQSLTDATNSIKNESAKWEKSAGSATENITAKIGSMAGKIAGFLAAAKVGQALADFGRASVDVASALAEVQNVVDVTFGDSASEINTWAKNAQSQFGLTELQAKKFASTMGALMKSAGMAGPEIVSMSKDMAGLAADMASFYNIDFETAFQKIRAGISGETEPLKQLGVNMSVVNLEAFAMTKGITKAFSEMSQSEQIMLRYQYLMQATADAQGDFARTASSFENAKRRIDTAITSIQSSLGTVLYPVIAEATDKIAKFLEDITQTPEKNILDTFNDIDIDTESKIKQIQKTASEARLCLSVLNQLSEPVAKNNSLTEFVTAFSSDITGLDSALKKAKENDLSGTIRSVAGALSANIGGDASKWTNLLTAISENAGGAIAAISGDSGATAAFLGSVAKSSGDLSTDYSAYWRDLLQALGDNAASAILALSGGVMTGTILKQIAEGSKGVTDNGNIWGTLLGALKDNAGAAISALQNGASVGEVLTSIAEGAEGYTTDKSGIWKALLDAFGGDGSAVLAALSGNGGAGSVLLSIALGANTLDASSQSTWKGLLGTLQTIDGINVLKRPGAGKTIEDLAKALSGASPDTTKAAAWKEFLDALGSNTEALSSLTGASAEESAAWLERMATAANSLNEDDANGWSELMNSLLLGLPGLMEQGDGSELFSAIKQNLLAMGSDSEAARYGLMGLGLSTEQINQEQQAWLATCKKLVQAIPGLAEVINTETGAVEGGLDAIDNYVTEWQRAQEKIIAWKAYYAKKEALLNAENGIGTAIFDEKYAKAMVDQTRKALEEGYAELAKKAYGKLTENPQFDWSQVSDVQTIPAAITALQRRDSGAYFQALALWNDYTAAVEAADKASQNLIDTQENQKTATAALSNVEQQLLDEYGPLEEEATKAAEAMTTVGKAAEGDEAAFNSVKKAVADASKAFGELENHIKSVHDATHNTVSGVLNGFNEVITPAEQKTRDLTEQLTNLTEAQNNLDKSTEDGSKQWQKYQKQIEDINQTINEVGKGSTVSAMGMATNLNSQLEYIRKYKDAMDEARARGVSDEILASLSDGTTESYNYLKALAIAGPEEVKAVNDAYKAVQDESAAFVDELTAQKLKVDEAYQGMVKAAEDAANGLNFGEEAKASVEATVQGIVDGLGEKKGEVEAEVDAIIATIGRLGNLGGGFNLVGGLFGWFLNGSHENGLDYVPFDHYLAELHEGEGILTAEENRVWQNFKHGGASTRNAFDYGAMSGAIWENAPSMGGGNVYLDGQTVGRVISARQADSYRALERSGWQR